MTDTEWLAAQTIAHNHILLVLAAHLLANSQDRAALEKLLTAQVTLPPDMPDSFDRVSQCTNEILEDFVATAEKFAEHLDSGRI